MKRSATLGLRFFTPPTETRRFSLKLTVPVSGSRSQVSEIRIEDGDKEHHFAAAERELSVPHGELNPRNPDDVEYDSHWTKDLYTEPDSVMEHH